METETMRLVLVLGMIVSSFAFAEDDAQSKALAAIEKCGGRVTMSKDDKDVVRIYLGQTQAGDAELELLKGLTQLEELSLANSKVTDAGMAHLAGLTKLQSIHLADTAVGDEGLKKLQG